MLLLSSKSTNLTLNCLRTQCQDYTMHNTETNTTLARGRKTYTCPAENPKLGTYSWLENKWTIKTCLEKCMTIFLSSCTFSSCTIQSTVWWKLRCTKHAQIVQVNKTTASSPNDFLYTTLYKLSAITRIFAVTCENNMSTVAPISSVWSCPLLEGLAGERHAPIASTAASNHHLLVVHKVPHLFPINIQWQNLMKTNNRTLSGVELTQYWRLWQAQKRPNSELTY